MIKQIFICIVFSNFLFANILLDEPSFGKLSLEKYTKIYIDKSSLGFDNIKNKEFEYSLKSNFTATNSTIWSYFSINTLKDMEVFFENIKAGIDFIDVYILKDDILIQKIELGDYREIKNREIKTKNSVFALNLDENSTYKFYIKHKSYSSISTLWEIYSKDAYEELLSFRSLIWGFFIGTIFILAFHNLFVYFSTKQIAFLFYVVFMLSTASYQLLVNGVFYEYLRGIDLNILSGLGWIISFFSLLATMLLHFSILKPKKGTMAFKLILFATILVVFTLLYYSFCIKYPEIRYSVKYTNIVSFFVIFTLIFTSLLSYKTSPYGKIYFFVLLIYIILAFYIISVLVGIFEYFDNFWIFLPISTLIDVALFTIVLYTKLKDIERTKKEQEQFIISQARFTSLGNNVANMIHQWKNPIAQIGSQIALLETTYHFDKTNYIKTSQETIPHIKSSILFLKDTMNDIYNFYKNPLKKESFNINEQIETLLRILDSELSFNNIKLYKDIDENINIFNYKTSFLNTIMIILENAIFQLKNFKKEDKKIYINLYKTKLNIVLEIEDNGGGIDKKNINKVFNSNFSTKKDAGSGIGLALAKKLVEKRLFGKIEVKNSNYGAKFILSF